MALIECEYCGEKVGNLMLHYRECSKARKALSKEEPRPVKRATVNANKPDNKIIYRRRGRPRKSTSCSLCDNIHRAKGLCLRCYMREYMRNKRSILSHSTII